MLPCCMREARQWTRHQWGALLTLGAAHFFNGMCVSIQAPFYPAAAEAKGATSTQYGFVFGVFELVVFLSSPLFGHLLPRLGITRAFTAGLLTTGSMCIAFGFLNYIQDGTTFISCSVVLRAIEALGNTAFLTSSFSMVAQLFPTTVGTVFALVEMCFGFGMILGPTAGGAMYEVGGFSLPFGVLGGFLLVQALLSVFSLNHMRPEQFERGEFTLWRALSVPSVLLAAFAVFCASIAVGGLQATLERHLAQFELDPLGVGLVFMMWGCAYALLNPFWGWLADRIGTPRLILVAGSLLLAVGFSIVGPLPFLNLKPAYGLTVAGVVIGGVGLGAQLVAAFSEAHKSARAHGFPDTVATYALISSIWTSAFALGAFVGPTAAGFLHELVGFEWSTLFTVCWNLAVFLASLTSLLATSYANRMSRHTSGRIFSRMSNYQGYGTIPTKDDEEESFSNAAGRAGHVVERRDHVVERGGHVVERGGHVVERGCHVVERGDHVVDRGDHVVERRGHVAEGSSRGDRESGYLSD